MTIKSDKWIREMALKHGMIEPCALDQVRTLPDGSPCISYGVSSYGYDMRLDNQFKIFTPGPESMVIDPMRTNPKSYIEYEGPFVDIPPGSYVLANSLEYFRLPRRILTVVLGKSTYARSGILVNVTPGEPGWEGHWTIEISNGTPLPARVYAHMGIAQCLFFESDEDCEVSYADRKGKYMKQGRKPEPARL